MREIDIRKVNGVRIGIKAARKNLGLTQKQLADKVPMARSTLSELEAGTQDTNGKTWLLLKKALMVDNVEELMARWYYSNGRFISETGRIIKVSKD